MAFSTKCSFYLVCPGNCLANPFAQGVRVACFDVSRHVTRNHIGFSYRLRQKNCNIAKPTVFACFCFPRLLSNYLHDEADSDEDIERLDGDDDD